jgi:hypothetical protein
VHDFFELPIGDEFVGKFVWKSIEDLFLCDEEN